MAEPRFHRLRFRGSHTSSLQEQPPEASEALQYIRDTMQHARAFTAVSGLGLIIMGLSALAAAWIASRQVTFTRWLAVWLVEALLAMAVAAASIYRKATVTATPLFSGPARKVAMGLLPALAAGTLLTHALAHKAPELIVPTWLLVYGVGVIAGGAWSVAVLPIMGAAFMAMGTMCLVHPTMPDTWMAASFGGLHLIFGGIVVKKYGG
jgi:hypothetical protein